MDVRARHRLETQLKAERTFPTFIKRIEDTAGDPEYLISITADFKEQSAKFMRVAEQKQYEAVAAAYAMYSTALCAGNVDALVSSLKERDKSVKTQCSILAILQYLIGYGLDGAQYASRDKGVVLLLDSRSVPVSEACEFIKREGGLQKCYQKYRKQKCMNFDSNVIATDNTPVAVPGLSDFLQHDGDLAMVLIRLKNAKKGTCALEHVIPAGAVPDQSGLAAFKARFEELADGLAEQFGWNRGGRDAP